MLNFRMIGPTYYRTSRQNLPNKAWVEYTIDGDEEGWELDESYSDGQKGYTLGAIFHVGTLDEAKRLASQRFEKKSYRG